MLAKVLKYDFWFAARMFGGANIAMLAVGLLIWLVGSIIGSSFERFFILFNFQAALSFGLLVYIFLRLEQFYRWHFFGEAHHLMMTLPVGRGRQLFSKYVMALLWAVLTMLTFFISLDLLRLAAGGVVASGILPPAALLVEGGFITRGLEFVIISFTLVAFVFFGITLAHQTFFGRKVGRLPAILLTALGVAVLGTVYFLLRLRHREWVMQYSYIWVDGQPQPYHYYQFVTEMGWAVGRIPVGEYYIDLIALPAVLVMGLAAAALTYRMLRK